ncbi:hypothetical protein HD806DRAFT_525126 [Xylariaceae sp. AK1471]|nr:hypothetical protein HD806DRAFT_525126 [Xylariaceae sp. AK1471]
MSFTLMPFLYQTRTILRIPPHRASAVVMRSLHSTPRRANNDSIPFDYEVGQPEEDIPDESTSSRGTITPTERQIFERIFSDIRARGLKPGVSNDGPQPTGTANRSAMLIMQQAAHDAGQARPATVTAPGLLSGAAKDRAKALLRFPPELRGAASKALNTVQYQATRGKTHSDGEEDDFIDEYWQAPAHSFARTVELESMRYPERTRIEGLITSANSDFELWDILEKDVFTMPARLDATGNDAGPVLEASKVEYMSGVADNVASPDGSQKLSLYVHGPLYPAYLLLALRRLDTAFHAPSPLVYSVLPRIKELGLESYVLGVSTPFFNELLGIYWARHGNLSGMLDLLEEMRHCGLYFDGGTASILNQVDLGVTSLASANSRSGFGRALMLMPEYEKSQRERIRHWHRAVDISARQRKADIGFAESAV